MPFIQPPFDYSVDEADDERQRKIDGVLVEARNPFGFWYIIDEDFPETHEEAFTSLSEIEGRIKRLKKGTASAKASSRSGRKQLQQGTGDGGVGA